MYVCEGDDGVERMNIACSSFARFCSALARACLTLARSGSSLARIVDGSLLFKAFIHSV